MKTLQQRIVEKKQEYLSAIMNRYTFDSENQKISMLWPEHTHAGHTVPVSNGTTALLVATKMLKVQNVVIPDTVPMVKWALEAAGANCIVVPCNQNLVMDFKYYREFIMDKVDHDTLLYVASAGIIESEFLNFCKTHKNKQVIVDMSHAHGTTLNNLKVENFGVDAICWSFFATKILNSGEGGMVWFESQKLGLQADRFVNAGKDRGGLIYKTNGFNYRISEYGAAIMRAEIDLKEEIYQARKDNAKIYQDEGILSINDEIEGLDTAYYKYPVRVKKGHADKFEVALKSAGVALSGRIYGKEYNFGRPWGISAIGFDSHVCLPISHEFDKKKTVENVRLFKKILSSL